MISLLEILMILCRFDLLIIWKLLPDDLCEPHTITWFFFAQMQFLQYVEKVIRYICDLYLEEIQSKLFRPKHSVPNGMKSQTWKLFWLLRKIQIHQQTKGLILMFYYQFNQVIVIKSEEITNISPKFNKNTVQSANPCFNSWI